MASNPDSPASPVAQASETFEQVVRQHCGLTKRETAAIASLKGQRASGSFDADQAWKDADALFASPLAAGVA